MAEKIAKLNAPTGSTAFIDAVNSGLQVGDAQRPLLLLQLQLFFLYLLLLLFSLLFSSTFISILFPPLPFFSHTKKFFIMFSSPFYSFSHS